MSVKVLRRVGDSWTTVDEARTPSAERKTTASTDARDWWLAQSQKRRGLVESIDDKTMKRIAILQSIAS